MPAGENIRVLGCIIPLFALSICLLPCRAQRELCVTRPPVSTPRAKKARKMGPQTRKPARSHRTQTLLSTRKTKQNAKKHHIPTQNQPKTKRSRQTQVRRDHPPPLPQINSAELRRSHHPTEVTIPLPLRTLIRNPNAQRQQPLLRVLYQNVAPMNEARLVLHPKLRRLQTRLVLDQTVRSRRSLLLPHDKEQRRPIQIVPARPARPRRHQTQLAAAPLRIRLPRTPRSLRRERPTLRNIHTIRRSL